MEQSRFAICGIKNYLCEFPCDDSISPQNGNSFATKQFVSLGDFV